MTTQTAPAAATDRCSRCSAPVEALAGPVETGGWYDAHLYVWRDGILVLDDVRCVACRETDEERDARHAREEREIDASLSGRRDVD